jgi:hypothetical protein
MKVMNQNDERDVTDNNQQIERERRVVVSIEVREPEKGYVSDERTWYQHG